MPDLWLSACTIDGLDSASRNGARVVDMPDVRLRDSRSAEELGSRVHRLRRDEVAVRGRQS